MMRLHTERDRGAALLYVLVFVTVISIWLAGTLFLIQSSSSEITATQAQDARVRAGLSATVSAISYVANSASMGITGQSNCGITGSTSYTDSTTGVTVDITCEALQDSGAIQPMEALILQGASGTIGIDAGLAVDGGGTLAVTSGIRNVSGLWSLPTSGSNRGNATAQNLVRVPGSSSCGNVKDYNNTTLQARCLSSSVDLNLDPQDTTTTSTQVKNYWKTATGSTSGGIFSNITRYRGSDTSTLNVVTVPTCITASDWNTGTVTLSPGFYDQNALDALNNLTDGSSTWGKYPLGNCAQPSSLPTTGPGAGKVTLRMLPGTYVFDFTWPETPVSASVGNVWKLRNPKFQVITSTASVQQPLGEPVSPSGYYCLNERDVAASDTQLASQPNGVQWQFGGVSAIESSGLVVLCPTTFHSRPQISVVALKCNEYGSTSTVCNTDAMTTSSMLQRQVWSVPSLGFEASKTTCVTGGTRSGAYYQQALLCSLPPASGSGNYGFQIDGGVFAPVGALILNTDGGTGANAPTSVSSFSNGLLVKAMKATLPGRTAPFNLPRARQFNGDRWLKVTVRDHGTGKVLAQTEVRVLDQFGQNYGSGVQIVSQS